MRHEARHNIGNNNNCLTQRYYKDKKEKTQNEAFYTKVPGIGECGLSSC